MEVRFAVLEFCRGHALIAAELRRSGMKPRVELYRGDSGNLYCQVFLGDTFVEEFDPERYV